MPEPVAPVVPPAAPVAPPAAPVVPPVGTPPAAPTTPPAVPPVAVEYKFDAVEGYPETEAKRITEYAREMGLDPDAAKKLHAADVKAWKADIAAIETENAQQRTAWQVANKADAEFGGPKFDQTTAGIEQLLARTKNGPALAKQLDAFGLRHQPEMFRFLAELAAATSEGKFVQATTKQAEKPMHERLYPSGT